MNLHNAQFQIQNWTINAVVGGNRPLIVFLHGLGGSWQWWQPTLAALSDDFSMCAIDLPGADRSSPLLSPPEQAHYKALVAQLIARLALGPAIVVGHSLGGYVAIQAVIQHAPGIKALCLVAPSGIGPVHNKLLRLLSLPVAGDALIRVTGIGPRIFLRTLVHNPKCLSDEVLRLANIPLTARKQFLYQLRLGVRLGSTLQSTLVRSVEQLPMPVSLFWGKYDSVFPVHLAYHAPKVLHAPPPVIFEHSGHIVNLEEPDRFDTELRSFASGLV